MIDKLPGDLVATIRSYPQAEWNKFFNQLAADQAMQIEGRVGFEEVSSLQAEIKQIRTIQNLFISQFL